MNGTTLELTHVGDYWAASGDLFFLTRFEDNLQARVYVDSIGETWVDVRRIPEGGYFHTERVEAYRAPNGAYAEEVVLRERGFAARRMAPFAHRVVEKFA